jgi:hypothetical protein
MKRDVPHFRIGLLLTEAGILAPQQLDDAIKTGSQSGLPFLKVLVSSGTLKQHELQAVIRAQSLIWSGFLDVERAVKALSIVHDSNVSIDESLRSVGWSGPVASASETLVTSVQLKGTGPPGILTTYGRCCQYCATVLPEGAMLCPFCTGDNRRVSIHTKMQLEPAWQRDDPDDGTFITATMPPRDPLLMAFISGACLAGLGQVIIGQSAKGICLILLTVVLAVITGGVSSLVIFPISALDAYLVADKLRNGKLVGAWEFF